MYYSPNLYAIPIVALYIKPVNELAAPLYDNSPLKK
jgi:hypothetical protein